jgi:lipopolysaccharide/colanic/teichoic acid biosynthesis glycosyltransferase
MTRQNNPPDAPSGIYARFGKRALDLFCMILALVVFSPIWLIVILLIRLDSPGPIFFFQERLGRYGKIFQAAKFRTMSATSRPRVPDREILPTDPELTRVGSWLRRFKVDEWPQVWNILKGEMSIIGPRPALPRQMAEFDDAGRKRLLVRPGLSGLAQVYGNIYLTWTERWQYDARYVGTMSFGLDVWIILRSASVMIRGEEKFLVKPPATKKD